MTEPVDLPPVQIAGMLVPAPLAARIIAAMRATYPQVTEGLDDDAAVRAVLRYWAVSTLAAHEEQQTQALLPDALEATRQEYAAQGQAAREKALADATAIVDAPTA